MSRRRRINKIPKDKLLIYLISKPDLIPYIKRVSINMQISIINENNYAIVYFKKPCYQVQLIAIQNIVDFKKYKFEYIKKYITYPDLLELLEFKILACEV